MLNLFIFNHMEGDEIISALLRFKETQNECDYYTAARGLIDFSTRRLTNKDIIGEYILRSMLEQDNIPDITCLRNFLRHDIKTIYNELLTYDWNGLLSGLGYIPFCDIDIPKIDTGLTGYVQSIEAMLECTSNEALGGAILAHVESFGTGRSSAYSALKWSCGRLVGTIKPDTTTFADLIDLEHQKNVLIANTDNFILGRSANNILLAGSSGTDKSSCITACLNMFKNSGLRLIELAKADIGDLPSVIDCVKNDILKYIIFIDDLEPDDLNCRALKSTLNNQKDGRNILIYATSCHPLNDDYLGGGAAENNTLSAHFGINLSFLAPTQSE